MLREGGGLIDLVRADDPLLFAAPTSISFPVNGGTVPVDLTDAGGGAGTWSVTAPQQKPAGRRHRLGRRPVSVPGRLAVTATVGQLAAERRRHRLRDPHARRGDPADPVLGRGDHPLLGTEPAQHADAPRDLPGDHRRRRRCVVRYRYPTGGDTLYPGPEVVYLVHVTKPIANFGVAVLSGHAVPHVVFAGDENHLVGFTGLPTDLNPYLELFGEARPVAGAILPAPGTYEIVFDTRSAHGPGRSRSATG